MFSSLFTVKTLSHMFFIRTKANRTITAYTAFLALQMYDFIFKLC